MIPSKDPLPFKLFLGYMAYPTETNYVAMTEMPYEGTTQGKKWLWLCENGTFYLRLLSNAFWVF